MKKFILQKPIQFILLAALCATIITVLFILGLIFQPIATWIILGIIVLFCVFVALISFLISSWIDKTQGKKS